MKKITKNKGGNIMKKLNLKTIIGIIGTAAFKEMLSDIQYPDLYEIGIVNLLVEAPANKRSDILGRFDEEKRFIVKKTVDKFLSQNPQHTGNKKRRIKTKTKEEKRVLKREAPELIHE